MANLPVIPSQSVGSNALAADWNSYVKGLLTWLDVNRPITVVTQAGGATQSLATATFTSITFTSEIIDRAGMHSTAVNTSRVNIGLEPGFYLCLGQVAFGGNATGSRRAKILMNGATTAQGAHAIFPNAGAGEFATAQAYGFFTTSTSTDYVELQGYQNSGGALSTASSGDYTSWLAVVRLGS